MSKKIYVTRKIPEQGMAVLTSCDKLKVSAWGSENVVPREDLLKCVQGVDGLLCTISDNIDKELLDAAGPQLKAISTLSVGTAHIDMNECKKRGIEVVNTADVASDSASEFAVTLVLLVARRLLEGMDAVKNGEWGLWKPMWICGFEMGGRTLGLFGFGRVAFGIARRLKPFNISRIIYYDLYHKEYASSVGAELVDVPTLLAESDMLCICCAATPQTIKMFNKDFFAKMKEGSIFINTARGILVEHDDLDQALKEGRPMAAGLDVTDPEPLPSDHALMSNPKCIITPHLATSTRDTIVNMSKNAADNLYISLLGVKPPSPPPEKAKSKSHAAGDNTHAKHETESNAKPAKNKGCRLS